jgi:DNA-binding response OmpR family regulator
MIKVLIISADQTIKFFVEKNYDDPEYQFITFSSTTDPLDIMSQICSINPSILILDDDLISPNSVHLLNSLKKVNPKTSIIFITSNTSLEFGRQINSIGVKFYLMKPFSKNEFQEFLKSVHKQLQENIY